MAGAMRKMAVYLGLVEDDQYDDDYYYEDDARGEAREDRQYDRAAREADRSRSYDSGYDRSNLRVTDNNSVRVSDRDDELSRRRYSSEREGATPTRDWRTETTVQEPVAGHPAGTRAKPAAPRGRTSEPKVTTLHPRSYNDARRIGEEFRSGNPVIMNLTELDDVDAKRIVDFSAGLVFGLRGSIERITNKVFMLSPANVQLSADEARAQLQANLAASRN